MEQSSQQQQQQQQQGQQQYRPIHQSSGGTGKVCFHCKATIPAFAQICPVCGRPVNPNNCSFCGAEMEPEDRFCPECGNSRQGTVCPTCGTLNFRSFCRNCNSPLDELALEAIEQARQDPKYQRVLSLHERLKELEQQIKQTAAYLDTIEVEFDDEDFEQAEQPHELSDSDKALLSEYEQLLSIIESGGGFSGPLEHDEPQTQTPVKPKRKPIQLKISLEEIEKITDAYKQTLVELNEAMEEMMPDPGAAPHIQSNYYSARKLPGESNISFKCKTCNTEHKQPSECPAMVADGKWSIVDDVTNGMIATTLKKMVDLLIMNVFRLTDVNDMPLFDKVGDSSDGLALLTVGNKDKTYITILLSGKNSYKFRVPPYDTNSIQVIPGKYRIVCQDDDPKILPYRGVESFDKGSYRVDFYTVYY